MLRSLQTLYYVLCSIWLAWAAWTVSGITPYGHIKPRPFETTELVLRWSCLFLCLAVVMLCFYFLQRRHFPSSWRRLSLATLVTFNVAYLFASFVENFFSGFASNYEFYLRNYRVLPIGVGLSNLIAMIPPMSVLLACYVVDRLSKRKTLP